MAVLDEIDDGFVWTRFDQINGCFRGSGRFRAVPESIDHRHQSTVWKRRDDVPITTFESLVGVADGTAR